MPYWIPPTFAVGGYVTALDANQYWRDNPNDLKRRLDTAFPAAQQTINAGSFSTSLTTWSAVDASFTLSYSFPYSHNLMMWFVSKAQHSGLGGIVRFSFEINGTRVGNATEGCQNLYINDLDVAGSWFPFVAMYMTAQAAGAYTIIPKFSTNGPTAQLGYGTTQWGYQVMAPAV